MSKSITRAGWDHAPHIDEETKRELLASFPPSERKARTQGEPVLGSGLVLPVEQEVFVCQPIPIAPHWPRICGVDFGWDHPAAASWLAWDRDADIVYVTDCWRMRETTPAQQAPHIIAKGAWIPVAWPHDGLQHDKGSGDQLAHLYRAAGVNMLTRQSTWPDGGNSVEAGISDILQRMQSGRWRVFSTCGPWLDEHRTYHRKNGVIVKKLDDVISSSRYALMSLRYAKTKQSDAPVSRPIRYGVAGY